LPIFQHSAEASSRRSTSTRSARRFDAWRDVRGLFDARPDNTLLVKASYWLGR